MATETKKIKISYIAQTLLVISFILHSSLCSELLTLPIGIAAGASVVFSWHAVVVQRAMLLRIASGSAVSHYHTNRTEFCVMHGGICKV